MKYMFPVLIALFLLPGCSKDDTPGTPDDPDPKPVVPTIKIEPGTTFQEMIGFGGALTWYSERIVPSPNKEAIYELLFEDLGMDILRLKNWYYPAGYPDQKAPIPASPTWFGNLFTATNEFYNEAKSRSPEMEVLFSSWGPPPALKSNNNLNEGTLKKNEDGNFMYDEFGQYFRDIFDHITFVPDYLSIQNEPSYTNPGWETCEWRPLESIAYPGYALGMDAVYDHLKDLPEVPVFIGPESPNISSNTGARSYFAFADVIEDRDYLGMYAWHPYNFQSGSSVTSTTTLLSKVYNDFNDRPNMMTEFSDNFDWLSTARFINNSLIYANTSAYIYWKLVWGINDDPHAMIYVSGNGTYEVRPFYWLMKHFSKHIDRGYTRIEATPPDEDLETSAFLSPDGTKLTIIVINATPENKGVAWDLRGMEIKEATLYQSVDGAGQLYRELNNIDPKKAITLPGKSVNTFVMAL